MGIMADYVDYSDDIRRAGGKSKGAFHFEVASEGEEDDDMPAIQPGWVDDRMMDASRYTPSCLLLSTSCASTHSGFGLPL